MLRKSQHQEMEKKGLEELAKRVTEGPLKDRFQDVRLNPEGEVKMSDILERFIDPYLDAVDTPMAQENLLEIAVVAWNLALISSEDKRKELREKMLNEIFEESTNSEDERKLRQETQEILDTMITRKEKWFHRYDRMIIDFELQQLGDEMHLSVMSTLAPSND